MMLLVEITPVLSVMDLWSNDTWNDVGDWCYYQLHPNEKDPVHNRKRPTVL